MEDSPLSTLERTILTAKGLGEEHLAALEAAGVRSRADFETIGDAATLQQILPVSPEVAADVMAWAAPRKAPEAAASGGAGSGGAGSGGAASGGASGGAVQNITVEDPSVVRCANCGQKQPHDYATGDLCPNCGRQAEPLANCYWCQSTGTGRFCRRCAAPFVKNKDYEIAVLLKREGVSKQAISDEVLTMSESEKEARLTQLRSGHY